jgi:hypothetical protein
MLLVLMPEEALLATQRRWLQLPHGSVLPPVVEARFRVFVELWSLGLWLSPGMEFSIALPMT